MALKCDDCSGDVQTSEQNFGYEKGMVLCMSCYHAHVDRSQDEEVGITMREKYEIVEIQRTALMNKVIELESGFKRVYAENIELRIKNNKLEYELRKLRVQ